MIPFLLGWDRNYRDCHSTYRKLKATTTGKNAVSQYPKRNKTSREKKTNSDKECMFFCLMYWITNIDIVFDKEKPLLSTTSKAIVDSVSVRNKVMPRLFKAVVSNEYLFMVVIETIE